MGRFAKLSLKKFATLQHMGTLMAKIMILKGRLEVQVPPQYQECKNVPRQACRNVPRIQCNNVPRQQCYNVPYQVRMKEGSNVPKQDTDLFYECNAEVFPDNSVTMFLNSSVVPFHATLSHLEILMAVPDCKTGVHKCS